MKQAVKAIFRRAIDARFPATVSPMLCTLTREVVKAEAYIHEIKFDGYRIVAFKQKSKVTLASRSGLDYTMRYPAVEAALKKLPYDCIIDGEVCALNGEGLPDFDTLQKPATNSTIVYYAFDILWLNGKSLMQLPLTDRKELLQEVAGNNAVIRYSQHFTDPVSLYHQMKSMGMEGIVSKHRDSPYVPGQRGTNWYKTPTEMRQEYVVGGWVESGRGRPFASLLFGAYKNKQLEWVGHAGGGFKHNEMPAILKRLKQIEIKRKPFVNDVDYAGVVHWVKPELVANFKFATFTKSGRIRKPAIFLGFRNDKPAGTVVQEKPVAGPKATKKSTENKIALAKASEGSNWHKVEKIKVAHSETMVIDDCPFTATDIEREIWKSVTKMELIQYYHAVSRLLLPHLRDRPQSLHVKPFSAMAPGFYIKDMEGREPSCASIFSDKRKHKKAGKRDVIDYLVCNNEATLFYMVNLGCIDINPWTSRISSPEEPDYIIIDLDPSDNDFKKAILAAEATRELLKEHKIKGFPKTSGKTGIHIYLPCSGFTFAAARSIAENLCAAIHKLVPASTTTVVSVSARGNKLYLDPNQNDYADTVAAPYTVRPFNLPTVSTPLDWKEIKAALDPAAFTIKTISQRINKKRDIFAPVLDQRIAMANNARLSQWLE